MDPRTADKLNACECCTALFGHGELDRAGLCVACALTRALEDGDYAQAEAICSDAGMDAPESVSLWQLDALIADRDAAARVYQMTDEAGLIAAITAISAVG